MDNKHKKTILKLQTNEITGREIYLAVAQNIKNPEKNIEAGVQYIKSLNMSFRKIENKEERIKFILAAYNSGPAHIFDAMELAKKHGKNPHSAGRRSSIDARRHQGSAGTRQEHRGNRVRFNIHRTGGATEFIVAGHHHHRLHHARRQRVR